MKRLNNLPKYSNSAIMILCALSLLPIVLASLYGAPFADDFSYSVITKAAVREHGLNLIELLRAAISQIIYSWHNWQGTYSSIFIMALQPGIFGNSAYFITTFIMLSAIIFSFLFFTKAVLSLVNAERFNALFIGVIIAFSFIQIMPSPMQGLFWFNGSAHYIIFLAAVLIMAGVNIIAEQKGYSVGKTISCSLLCFFISGGNLITAFLNIMILLGFAIFYIYNNKKKSYMRQLASIAIFLFFAGIGFLINCASPGNASRQGAIENLPSFVETIKLTSMYFFYFVRDWLNLSYWLTLFIISPMLIKLTKAPRGYCVKGLLIIIAGLYTITCGMLCVPYFSMGNYGDPRVTNAIFGAMSIMSYILYGYALGLMQEKGIFKFNCNTKSWSYLIVQLVFWGGIIICGNITLQNSTSLTAVREFGKGIPQAVRAVTKQQSDILNNPAITDAYLPAHIKKSQLISCEDVSESAGNWVNAAMASYYNKNTVTGLPPQEQLP